MGNNTSKVTDQDRAVLDLKIQRDRLRQYQKRIRVVLEREQEIAKECLIKKDKQRALLALRKRKYQADLLKKSEDQLQTLDELTASIEFALVQKDVVLGLEKGNEVLKTLNNEMSLDKIEKLMDESAEGIAYQNEVSETLRSHMSSEQEDEIESELEALEREVNPSISDKLPSVPNKVPVPDKLPSVPDKLPSVPDKQLDSESTKEAREPMLA